ncbi:helix-turn-helix transcriptional regulator [Anaerosphaera multitolerans]|uniref:HTH domain-containing protein n=1 Tax=Anaerosphaera multitolerans TaxID=2487351 RepID=A0A437S8L1_9FIRM|nr:HTH domain-containing protein [Anaerosphaera multitolerans]RVU55440.1 HTH domain-containing protein [Anaerosphaera multitolerans]
MKLDRRLEILLTLLQSDWVSSQELAEQHKVDKRTINRDMDFLKEAGIPIMGKRGNAGGYKVDDNFKLKNKKLSLKEQHQLMKTIKESDKVSEEQIEYVIDQVEEKIIESTKDWFEIQMEDEKLNEIVRKIKTAILREQEIEIELKSGEIIDGVPEKLIVKEDGLYLGIDKRFIKIERIKIIKLV